MNFTVNVNRAGIKRLRTATSLLSLTSDDMRGFVLPAMATVHRKQEERIFATEGAEGGSGSWPRLSPSYAKRKRSAGHVGRATVKGKHGKVRTAALRALRAPISQKILVWTGETKERFTRDRPGFIARVVERTRGRRWLFQFGAASTIASYHQKGAGRLPRRDMVKKTRAQIQELQRVVVRVYLQNIQRFRKAAAAGFGPRRAA